MQQQRQKYLLSLSIHCQSTRKTGYVMQATSNIGAAALLVGPGKHSLPYLHHLQRSAFSPTRDMIHGGEWEEGEKREGEKFLKGPSNDRPQPAVRNEMITSLLPFLLGPQQHTRLMGAQ